MFANVVVFLVMRMWSVQVKIFFAMFLVIENWFMMIVTIIAFLFLTKYHSASKFGIQNFSYSGTNNSLSIIFTCFSSIGSFTGASVP